MGLRGPPPKPTALRLVAGNPGRQPFVLHEPLPEHGPLVMPDEVATDPDAKRYWETIVPGLQKQRIATPLDTMLVARACMAWSRFVRINRFLRTTDNGTYAVRNRRGDVVRVLPFPHVAENIELQRLLIKYDHELGTSPAARSRIAAVTGELETTRDQAALRRKFFPAG